MGPCLCVIFLLSSPDSFAGFGLEKGREWEGLGYVDEVVDRYNNA